jgi:protein-tyrosine phosphatase
MSFLRRILSNRRRGLDLYWLTSDIAVSREPELAEWADVVRAGIHSVVDLRAEQPDNALEVQGHGLRYLRLPITDGGAPSDQQLALVTDWIVERIGADGPVLIHCREGRGRSPLVACAALVKLGMPAFEAYQVLRRARPQVALSGEQEEVLRRFAKGQERRYGT